MQNILTVEEVVERINKADSAPRQPQTLDSPKLRPEPGVTAHVYADKGQVHVVSLKMAK